MAASVGLGMGKNNCNVEDGEVELNPGLDIASVEDKREKIYQACRDKDLDVVASLALSADGLLEDQIRREVCK